MIGLYVLGTLLIGGALFSIFDDDDDNSSDVERDTEQQSEPDLPSDIGDLLQLGDDDDTLEALDGDDTVFAGAGNDQINGDAGRDDISGQAGNDTLSGGDDADVINSGAGNDTVIGDDGADTLLGSSGEDLLVGGNDDDLIVGGSGHDILQGQGGDDVLFGGEFDREPTADELRDAVAAGEDLGVTMQNSVSGADTLVGGAGDDTLYLGARDVGIGGTGEDSFVVLSDDSAQGIADISDYNPDEDNIEIQINDPDSTLNEGNFELVEDDDTGDAMVLQNGVTIARIEDGAGQLTLDDISLVRVSEDGSLVPLPEAPDAAQLPPGAVEGTDFADRIELEGDEAELISAGEGDDTVFAGSGDDNVFGDEGDDALFGQGGDDTIAGGDGSDILYASNGDDVLSGGEGNDVLFGSAGSDEVAGGDDNDFLVGGSGADEVSGGDGNDFVYGGEFDRVPNQQDADQLRENNIVQSQETLTFDSTTTSGADTLNGGGGDDILVVGASDIASGGTGSDTFAILTDETPEGVAIITDYDPDEDVIQIVVNGTVPGPADENFTIEEDGDDALIVQQGVTLARVVGAAGEVESLAFRVFVS